MCGICGIIDLTPEPRPTPSDLLDRMTDVLSHRGPDGRGTYHSWDHRVAFGHRRLAIIDLSPLGAQPMVNEDGMVRVTFNGEIYNHVELRRLLESRGHGFRSQADTEVLLHGYEEWGTGLLDRLDGDFAFAVWDERRQCGLVARDPAGVKPLYYTWSGSRLLFASEIKALLTHPDVPRRMDPVAFYHYLSFLVVPAPATIYQGVRKLRAGEAIELAVGRPARTWKYWTPSSLRARPDPSRLDEEFETLYRASVRKRLMSDVPVGLLFSGGVDSTLNSLAFAEEVGDGPIHTYNVAMQGRRFNDESGFASEVAALFGLGYLRVDLDQDGLLAAMDDVAWGLDEPVGDPVSVAVWAVTRLARRDGMTVLHAGEGADELFCGYDIARRFLRHHRQLWRPLSRLPQWVAGAAFRTVRHSTHPRVMKVADVLRRRARGQGFYMAEAIGFYDHEKSMVLRPGFERLMDGHDSFLEVEPLYEELAREVPAAEYFDLMSYIELSTRLPDLLLTRTDKMAMANGIEVRVPFMDRALMEFALATPLAFKLRDGIAKEPVKRLAARLATKRLRGPFPPRLGASPRDLIYRPKSGFGVPTQDWFLERLGADFAERLRRNRPDWEEWLDVEAILSQLRAGPATVNRAYQLWTLYSAVVWRERFRVA